MKPLFFLFAIMALLSCGRTGYLTQTQVNDEATHMEPFDTLAAYRKYPGAPKTVEVKAYTKSDGTQVAAYKRSPRTTQ